MRYTPLSQIQNGHDISPKDQETVLVEGVVTTHTREGFVLQSLENNEFCGLFVNADEKPRIGTRVTIKGKIVEFQEDEADARVTQLESESIRDKGQIDMPKAIELSEELLGEGEHAMRDLMCALAGVRVKIRAGATFVSASNAYADYVVSLKDQDHAFTKHGGVLAERYHHRVFSFRVHPSRRDDAPLVHVGSRLESDIVGVVMYRAGAFQIETRQCPKVMLRSHQFAQPELKGDGKTLTVMTLNAFNLDPQHESRSKVLDRRDIDDDVGDRRYEMLAADVAHCHFPDIIAAQEFQDDDGAEQSEVRSAKKNIRTFVRAISRQKNAPHYYGIDRLPGDNEGGQPNAHIRNVFLYNKERVVRTSNSTFGEGLASFEDTRLPHVARFRLRDDESEIAIINVHLSSKRGTYSSFHHERPGYDPRLEIRVEQAKAINALARELENEGVTVYMTGDFNDTETSETLHAACGEDFVNLTNTIEESERYDYNHRGGLQSLTHGLVAKENAERVRYEAIHGNEILGVKPGGDQKYASDHAYVVMAIDLGDK